MVKKVSLIVPFYNEESNAEGVIKEAREVLESFAPEYEILAVDDGSIDETAYLLDGMAKKIKTLRVFHHEKNKGYGAALATGIENAAGDYVLLVDGDGQFYLEDLKMIAGELADYDAVLGYRINRQDPWIRRLNSNIYNWCARILVGVKIKDINCAMKGFRKTALNGIKARTSGAIINSDILSQVLSKGVKFKEVGVRHRPRLSGVQTGANPRVIIKAMREFIKIFIFEFPKRKNQIFFSLRIFFGFLFALYLVFEAAPSTTPRFFAGMLAALSGVFFRNWAGGHVKKSKELCVLGPYSLVRHPLYFGSMLIGLGALISIVNREHYIEGIFFTAVFLWIFIYVYLPKIASEEKNLANWFPGEYEKYSSKVGALFPKMWNIRYNAGNFSWQLWKKHQEYKSIIGFALFYLVMYLKR